MSRNRQRGFTLMELIVSITLVSMISVGMLTAMRTSMQTLDKIHTRLDDNRSTAGLEQMISRQLGGAMPVSGACSASGSYVSQVPVFGGTPQSLHFVSTYSMTEGSRGYPRFLEYQVVPEVGGTVKLMVTEHLFSGPAATAPFCFDNVFLPARLGPDSLLLADRLAYCRIWYRDRDQSTQLPSKWLEVWDRPDLPSGIRIEMLPAAPDPSRIGLVGFTVPLHITRKFDVVYQDQ